MVKHSGERESRAARWKAPSIVLLLLLCAYGLFKPVLEAQLGLSLPSLTQIFADEHPPEEDSAERPQEPPSESQERPSGQVESSSNRGDTETEVDAGDLKYGLLRELDGDRFLSPAGLVYGPGSQEGHRLAHLERHTRDDPNRPGEHGVFDGGMEQALKEIDAAYQKAKDDDSGVTVKEDQGRKIYTISLGKRVGYVGGRDGNRRRKPQARRIRLVLEGNNVITAFPL